MGKFKFKGRRAKKNAGSAVFAAQSVPEDSLRFYQNCEAFKQLQKESKKKVPPWVLPYLVLYQISWDSAAARKAVGVSHDHVAHFAQRHPSFAKLIEEVTITHTEILEGAALKRAAEGWLEPVWYQGDKVGANRKWSDTLQMFFLKARKPDEYSEKILHGNYTSEGKAKEIREFLQAISDASGGDGDEYTEGDIQDNDNEGI